MNVPSLHSSTSAERERSEISIEEENMLNERKTDR